MNRKNSWGKDERTELEKWKRNVVYGFILGKKKKKVEKRIPT